MSSGHFRTAVGYSEWVAPYRAQVRIDLGSSEVFPLSLPEFSEIAGVDAASMFSGTLLAYAPAGGSASLRESVASTYPNVLPEHVAVCGGAGEALIAIAASVASSESHIIAGLPCYAGLVRFLEASPAAITYLPSFATLDEIVAAITPSTTAVFLTSPHNPTGRVLPAEDTLAIAAALDRVEAVLVVDEVFKPLMLRSIAVPGAASLAPNCVSVSGLSKAYGLPGLRIGWAAGPPLLIDDVRARQQWTSHCVPALNESAAEIALNCADALLTRSRSIVFSAFSTLSSVCDQWEGVNLALPDGGTAAFVSLPVDETQWCIDMVERRGLVVAPGGVCFGLPGHVRINLGASPKVWSDAVPLLYDSFASTSQLFTG
jgi:aspartate/methionine/tyrosine aminotransferase